MSNEAAQQHAGHGHAQSGLLKLSVGAIGVVFGDIGTSPLYAFRETFAGHHPLTPDELHILGVLSLIGGFFAAGGVVKLDGSVLIWVFPVLVLVYGLIRWWLITRVYGGSPGMECDARQTMSWHWRILLIAGLMGFVALVFWWRGDHDDTLLVMLCGMGAALGVFLVVATVRRLRGKAE